MAAITKRFLHLRPTFHSYARSYPHPLRHFSSSSDGNDVPQPEQSQTRSSVSSSLNDVRASLHNRPPPRPTDRRQPPRTPFSGSTDEIRHNLAEFRDRSALPPPAGEKYVSLGELYEKGLKSKGESSDSPSSIGAIGGKQSFDFLRHSLHKLEGTGAANYGRKPGGPFSFPQALKDLKMKADSDGNLAAGIGGLIPPYSQQGAKRKQGGGSVGGRAEIGKRHDLSELGKKLEVMRPDKRKGKCFSLQEMSDRLAKVRKAEQEEVKKNPQLTGVVDSLQKLQDIQMGKQKVQPVTVGVLGSMGVALDEKIAGPPKDQFYLRINFILTICHLLRN